MSLPIFSFHIFFLGHSFTYEDGNLTLSDVCSFFENLGLNLLSDPLQKLTPEYKQHLIQYFHDQASEVKSFHAIVNDIKKQDENNFFMVFHLGNGEPFSHEKCDKIDLYLEAIHKVENIKKIQLTELPFDEIDKLYQIFIDIYSKEINPFDEFYSYISMTSNQNTNIKITTQEGRLEKKCRFCFQTEPTVTFKDRAHAISRGLGNEGIFCFDECDTCNHYFGEGIEKHLTTFLSVQRLSVISATRKELYENGTILRNDNKVIVIENKSQDFLKDIQVKEDHLEINLEPKNTFVPQSLFKALCKIALSVIEEQSHLDMLEETIKWVRSDISDKTSNLMVMGCYYEVYAKNDLKINIWTRANEDQNLPFKIIKLKVGQTNIFYALPFASNQKENFKLEALFNQFDIGISKEIWWQDLGSTNAIKANTTLKLEKI